MLQSNIPLYIDPDSFETLGNAARFPVSTQFMVYRAIVSRYFLTIQTLQDYGINAEALYGPDNKKAVEQFIDEVTNDIYDVMARLAPYNYRYNCYLVAQSRSLNFPEQYAARKQFEKALICQAQYKMINVDVRDINGIDFDANTSIYHKQLRRELRHISPKSLDILKALGLLFNGNIPQAARLIDFGRFM